MSHARQTEHYELPLYDGNDIINPLTDFNNANSSIDEALYNANQRSVGAETTANEAKDIAEGYDTRVSQAIQTANDAMTLANNTQDMIADDFDPNKAGGYNVGDFVIYNGKLYRFINAHTGAWDASDVQVSPVLIEAIADVVDEGKQAIANAVDDAEQEIAGQTEKVTKTQAMIAQPFDENKSGGYAVDDVVTYADKLYKFTSAHSGAWTGLDVEQIDVIENTENMLAQIMTPVYLGSADNTSDDFDISDCKYIAIEVLINISPTAFAAISHELINKEQLVDLFNNRGIRSYYILGQTVNGTSVVSSTHISNVSNTTMTITTTSEDLIAHVYGYK